MRNLIVNCQLASLFRETKKVPNKKTGPTQFSSPKQQLLNGSIAPQTSKGDAEDVLAQREGTSAGSVSNGPGTVQAGIPWANMARSMASRFYVHVYIHNICWHDFACIYYINMYYNIYICIYYIEVEGILWLFRNMFC